MREFFAVIGLMAALSGCATSPKETATSSASTSASTPAADAPVIVGAVRETPPVNANILDDAADDPAIWIAKDPAQSRIIGTQKKGGLFVYDLKGAVVQEAPGGKPNNVDLRDGFAFSDGAGAIVATSDRLDQTLAIRKLQQDGRLDPVARARIPSGFAEVYGICLGRKGDDFYAVATSKTGDVRLWSLQAKGKSVDATLIKTWSLGSISEGCVVDDATGDFYVSQELVGLWRFNLDAKSDPVIVDRVAPDGHLAADVEGVALWDGGEGRGFLVVSAQGQNRFAVYDRVGGAYRGSFQIGPNGGVDGVSGTDGLDIVSAPLGSDFPRGLIVVQDDENTDPVTPQNFKYVSWAEVERALKLEATR